MSRFGRRIFEIGFAFSRFNALFMSVLVVLIASAVTRDSHADDLSTHIKSAAQSIRERKFDDAIASYEKARAMMPNNPEIHYNLGVAHYRKGEFDKAAEAFKQAMSLWDDGPLRSHSIYNMGNATYAQSLRALKEQPTSNPAREADAQFNNATELLKQAVENYKKAIDANPADDDAKANAELSNRLLKQLQEMQQQRQQQQQSGDPDQNQDQQEQQQQNQSGASDAPQSQDAEERSESQSGDGQNELQTRSEHEQQKGSPSPPTQEQRQEQDQPDPIESEANRLDEPKPQEAQSAKDGTREEKRMMTRQEADRILQAVRDKERRRRAELARREVAKYAPADKDW